GGGPPPRPPQRSVPSEDDPSHGGRPARGATDGTQGPALTGTAVSSLVAGFLLRRSHHTTRTPAADAPIATKAQRSVIRPSKIGGSRAWYRLATSSAV